MLEGAQAGLSWETILNKRDNYRAAFEIATGQGRGLRHQPKAELLANPGIVRNKLKIAAAIRMRAPSWPSEQGLTARRVPVGLCRRRADRQRLAGRRPPGATDLSDRLSKDLGKRGFKFVGSTIVYAYMQGIGMVDDHDRDCICRTRR